MLVCTVHEVAYYDNLREWKPVPRLVIVELKQCNVQEGYCPECHRAVVASMNRLQRGVFHATA